MTSYSVPAKGINDNVLTGIKCPHCGSQGPFVMAVTRRGYATVSDDGFDDFNACESEFDGPCECLDCGKDFNFMNFDDNDARVPQLCWSPKSLIASSTTALRDRQ